MQELADGLWRWTARHDEWHPGEWGAQVASFALDAGDVTLLIDPLVAEGDEAPLDALVRGPVAILITIPYHTRSAESLSERYGATIYGHPAVAKRLRTAKLEPIDGELRMWSTTRDRTRWYRERFVPTLAPLRGLQLERILVTHGEPVLRDGSAALRAALDAPPWYHHG